MGAIVILLSINLLRLFLISGTFGLWELFWVVMRSMQANTSIYLISLFVLIFVVMLPLYVLGSLGVSTIVRRQGVPYHWASWLGLCNSYVLAETMVHRAVGIVIVVLGSMTIIDAVAEGLVRFQGFVPRPLAFVIFVVYLLLKLVTLHYTYKKMSHYAIQMTVATALSFGILGPIFLFVIRNNEMIDTKEHRALAAVSSEDRK